ncbi:hypothetical protein U1Q18_024956 [Sarracenia purpurea var. burkii]
MQSREGFLVLEWETFTYSGTERNKKKGFEFEGDDYRRRRKDKRRREEFGIRGVMITSILGKILKKIPPLALCPVMFSLPSRLDHLKADYFI